MILLDHTEPSWVSVFAFENGAHTYSQDIVKYQIPRFEKVLGKSAVISTCARFSKTSLTGSYDVAIQYLHSYRYHGAVEDIQMLRRKLPFRAKRLIFLSAYEKFTNELNAAGFTAVHIPMAIDVEHVRQFRAAEANILPKFLWYGNITHSKRAMFNQTRRAVESAGYQFDYISKGLFNGVTPITKEEAWALASQYKYGAAVGRCAQELMALGVKTLIVGQRYGGIITNPSHYTKQLSTNMNGRLTTDSLYISDAVARINNSMTFCNDIAQRDDVQIITDRLGKWY